MKIFSLPLAGVLLSCGVAAAQNAPTKPDARLAPLFENVLLHHVDGEVSIPQFFKSDGSVYYVDLHLKLADLKENYTRTARWKLQGEEMCIIKTEAADDVVCYLLPLMKPGDVVDTTYRSLDGQGKVEDTGKGKLQLIPGRPDAAALASG